jgi:hypothetical protein
LFLWKKTQVKNDSAELLFFFHFWVFEVRRFRNPTNKISMALYRVFQIVLSGTFFEHPLDFNGLCCQLAVIIFGGKADGDSHLWI